jgi:hypothetical protein
MSSRGGRPTRVSRASVARHPGTLHAVDAPRPFTRRQVLAGTVGCVGAMVPLALLARDSRPETSQGNDTMHWADRSRGSPFSKDPSVVFFGGRYLMYFSIPPRRGDDRWGQAVAASDNLLNWTTIAELEPQGDAEAKGLCAGGAIILGDRVHLFYQTYGSGPRDAICHATSSDGVTFERSADNPILRPTGDWNCGRRRIQFRRTHVEPDE